MLQLFFLVCGLLLLMKGADLFVDGAACFANKFGIPQLVIGLTIVAMGTSMPEAAVSINAALKGNAEISIGNIVGSNILNILIILGITALITRVTITKSTLFVDVPVMLVITILLLFFGISGWKIELYEGIVFLVLFVAYLGYLAFYAMKNKETNGNEETKEIPIWKCVLAIIFGGIAIGNIVGSNIFNILFILGITSLICPIPFGRHFYIDTIIAFASGILLWCGTIRHKELRRPCGIFMLLAYGGYFLYLLF